MHCSIACVHCKSFARHPPKHPKTPQTTPNGKPTTHLRSLTFPRSSTSPCLSSCTAPEPRQKSRKPTQTPVLPHIPFQIQPGTLQNTTRHSPPWLAVSHSQPSQPQKHHIWPGASKTLRSPHLVSFHPPKLEDSSLSQVRNLPSRAIYHTYVRGNLDACATPDLAGIRRWSGEGSLLKEGEYALCGLLEGPGTGFARGR